MRATAPLLARLMKFRHGRCNAGNAASAAAGSAPKPAAANAPSAAPMGGPAKKEKPPHVIKPLGPNVKIVTLASAKDLPARFRRPAFSDKEMQMIDLGGAYDPPPPPPKKKK